MNLLLVAVEDVENIEDFLSVLVEMDVAGVQVIESSTVMDVLSREAPIFAGLRELMTRPTADSKLLVGVTNRDDVPQRFAELLLRVGLDLDKPGVGYAVCVPIAGAVGHLDVEGD
ncbi:MAG: hypothetical protein KGY99_07260 [Phycisphaerae bacterium]|nr:hypothetical protein [Phycisphaerae bacterium]